MEWLSVTELENVLGIPKATIRRYLNRHEAHIKFKKNHKSFLISSNSIDTLTKIRDFYKEGMNAEQVDENLNELSIPMTIEIKDEKKTQVINSSEVLQNIISALEEQKEFNQLLVERLNRQQEYIEKSIIERDKRLMETLRTFQEVSATARIEGQKKRKWYHFFSNNQKDY